MLYISRNKENKKNVIFEELGLITKFQILIVWKFEKQYLIVFISKTLIKIRC